MNKSLLAPLVLLPLSACANRCDSHEARREPRSSDARQPRVSAPVVSAKADARADAATMVRVFFSQEEEPVAVQRGVPQTKAVLRSALRELLEGPTKQEKERGLHSWFGPETAGTLRGVNITEAGRAIVDFSDFSDRIPNASTSAGSELLLQQLNRTVFQFDNVREVEYRFEGDCGRFWRWLQRECTIVERP